MKSNLKLTTACGLLLLGFSFLHAAIPAGYKGKPFTGDSLYGKPQKIPGAILGVYFDEGGEGVGFHEPDGARVWGGETIRKDPKDRTVEMQYFTTHDFLENGTIDKGWCHLSWTEPPNDTNWEWYNYTVHVDTAGTYEVDFHWAVAKFPNITSITFNDLKPDSQINIPLSIRPPNDHEIYHDWKWDRKLSTIKLDTGLYVLKLQLIKGNWNFDAMKFNLVNKTPIVKKNFSSTASFTAFQNNNVLNITYTANPGTVQFRIVDLLGNTKMQVAKNHALPSQESMQIPLKTLANGMYMLQMEENGKVTTQLIPVH